MLLKAKRREELPSTLTIKSQGDTLKVNVTYHNRKTSELEAMFKQENRPIGEVILFIVKDWDIEDYPLTAEGLTELEDDRPGLIMAIIQGWHQARAAAKEKN